MITRRSFAGITQWRTAESLSSQVIDQLVDQPPSWHQRQSDGQLLARAGVDVDTSVSVMAPIPFATGTVLMVVVAGAYLLYTDVVMGLVAVAVFPLLMILNVVYENKVAVHFDDAQEAIGEFTGAVHESFEAVQLVKAYGAQDRETARLSEMAGRVRDARIRAVTIRGTFEAVLDTLPSLTNIGLVVLGAYRVDSGDVTVGELSGFIFMFTLLVFPLRLIGYALSELPHSFAGYRRVRATVDDPLDPDPEHTLGHADDGVAVRLADIAFTFPDEDHPVIEHANADDHAGLRHGVRRPHGRREVDADRPRRRVARAHGGPGRARRRSEGGRAPGGVPVQRHGARQRGGRHRPRRRRGLGGAAARAAPISSSATCPPGSTPWSANAASP